MNLRQEIDSLLYATNQLCSDVETSISGQQGAHSSTLARVRSLMEKVRYSISQEEAEGLHAEA